MIEITFSASIVSFAMGDSIYKLAIVISNTVFFHPIKWFFKHDLSPVGKVFEYKLVKKTFIYWNVLRPDYKFSLSMRFSIFPLTDKPISGYVLSSSVSMRGAKLMAALKVNNFTKLQSWDDMVC